MTPRITTITLGVRDLKTATAFYEANTRQGHALFTLHWQARPASHADPEASRLGIFSRKGAKAQSFSESRNGFQLRDCTVTRLQIQMPGSGSLNPFQADHLC
jgi:hypothetical protein